MTVGLPLRPKKIASLPACDTPRVIEALKGVWDFVPVKNVFEAAIHADNVVMHLATTVLSATRIEAMRDNFILFQEGFTPASIRCAGKSGRNAWLSSKRWALRSIPTRWTCSKPL